MILVNYQTKYPMKHLSFDVLLVAPIPLHATTPDPGGPCIIWSSINSCLLTWTGTEWGSMVFDPGERGCSVVPCTLVSIPVSYNAVTQNV